jgi:TolB-like protein
MAYKKNFLVIAVVFLTLAIPSWAGGSKDKGTETTKQENVQTQTQRNPTVPLWTGEGGKGISLAVLEPTSRGLSPNEQWMLSLIQSSITGDFNKYSDMTIIDRQNLEKILAEQMQSMSGNYSDADYIRIGQLTNAKYILGGSVSRTANTFMLELAVTDVESGVRKASLSPTSVTPASLENLSAVKEASAELLRQLGIILTDSGLAELKKPLAISQVNAETALARGVVA